MTNQLPLVSYLTLSDDPQLIAEECSHCQARYFGRRNACASCFGTSFEKAKIQREGILETFTIVFQAAPGVEVPFVAGVINCGGTSVRANVVNVEPSPDHITLGMKVRLTTFSIGTDQNGVEAIGYGFEPLP
jgi:uncharacterized protein